MFGADVALQQQRGVTRRSSDSLYDGIDLSTDARADAQTRRARGVAELAGTAAGGGRRPELVVLPRDDGSRPVSIASPGACAP